MCLQGIPCLRALLGELTFLGATETLNNSLIRIMQVIPSVFVLHPGHGNDTTLKVEMEQNPFLLPLLNRVNSLK